MFTQNQFTAAKRLLAEGQSQRFAAEKTGISRGTVDLIAKGIEPPSLSRRRPNTDAKIEPGNSFERIRLAAEDAARTKLKVNRLRGRVNND